MPWSRSTQSEVDALYMMLYRMVHDLERSPDLTALQTRSSFARQWRDLPEGNYLLSDPWFRENVAKIVCEQELCLKPEWFRGRDVIDAGCGNGRWAYALAQLGANVTVVDVNPEAIEATRSALEQFDVRKEFIVSPLEQLVDQLPAGKKFDLVWSWGVVHHTQCFNRSLDQLTQIVRDGGILYLYLYGRESMSWEADLKLFKQRVRYNSLATDAERERMLLKMVGGDRAKMHNQHDLLAPLVNRRLDWDYVRGFLADRGFDDVIRTIDHTELFIRAIKGSASSYEEWVLPPTKPPYWFQHHD